MKVNKESFIKLFKTLHLVEYFEQDYVHYSDQVWGLILNFSEVANEWKNTPGNEVLSIEAAGNYAFGIEADGSLVNISYSKVTPANISSVLECSGVFYDRGVKDENQLKWIMDNDRKLTEYFETTDPRNIIYLSFNLDDDYEQFLKSNSIPETTEIIFNNDELLKVLASRLIEVGLDTEYELSDEDGKGSVIVTVPTEELYASFMMVLNLFVFLNKVEVVQS